jgi:hypothetical protein
VILRARQQTMPLTERLFALLHTVTRGLYGFWMGLSCLITLAALTIVALALVVPALWSVAVLTTLGALVVLALIGVSVLTRTAGHVFEAEANISLQTHLLRSGFSSTDFFVDEAAASPSLQLLLAKVLSLCQPTSILELGSGQSTKILSHYARQHPEVHILTIEEDARFHALLSETLQPPTNHAYRTSPLVPLEVSIGAEQVSTKWYRDHQLIAGQRFDLILIDGPTHGGIGTEFVRYSRSGVLTVLPDILAERFAIIVDDTDNYGHFQTARAIREHLRDRRVTVFERHGVKSQSVLCSPDWAFLRSM